MTIKKKQLQHIKQQQQNITKNLPKLRRLGDIMLDMEPLILEMCNDHDLQWYEILNLVRGYLEVHCPGAREEYTAGGNPIFYYGPAFEPKDNTEK